MTNSGNGYFGTKKLNADNYSVWSFKLELLLIKEKLWDVIKKEKPNPLTTGWIEKDDEARATIGLLVEDSQSKHIKGASSAREAWYSLTPFTNLLFLKKLVREGYKLTLCEDDNCEIVKNGKLQATTKLSPELYEVKTVERACAASGVTNTGHTE
ncbi:uncharacterized protein LOC144470622 [Augochlora pura]